MHKLGGINSHTHDINNKKKVGLLRCRRNEVRWYETSIKSTAHVSRLHERNFKKKEDGKNKVKKNCYEKND